MAGAFYLVSAGIGDADNITVRALKILQSADLVFAMDFLAKRFADVLEGKTVYPAGHCYFQDAPRNDAPPGKEDEYRHLIREAYGAGKTIVVMDFGDPGIFSPQRGYLNEFADLKPKVIPGISSFNAANAAIGNDIIPKAGTHAVVLTEAVASRKGLEKRLHTLAQTGATLVFFTMQMDLAAVTELLGKYYVPETPVCFVLQAGFAESEQVIRTTLSGAVAAAEKNPPGWAYLMYVGCA